MCNDLPSSRLHPSSFFPYLIKHSQKPCHFFCYDHKISLYCRWIPYHVDFFSYTWNVWTIFECLHARHVSTQSSNNRIYRLRFYFDSRWRLGGQAFIKKTPPSLRSCIVSGLLFGVVGTLPSLFLGTDLACSCETIGEFSKWVQNNRFAHLIQCLRSTRNIIECIGEGGLCAFNRASPYFLMVILLSLMSLLVELALRIRNTMPRRIEIFKMQSIVFAWLFPCFLMVIAFVAEGNDEGSENEVLNNAR